MTPSSGRRDFTDVVQPDQGVALDHGVFHLLLLHQVGLIDDLDRVLPRGTWGGWRSGGGDCGSLDHLPTLFSFASERKSAMVAHRAVTAPT